MHCATRHQWVQYKKDHRIICLKCQRITTKRRTYLKAISFKNEQLVNYIRRMAAHFLAWHNYSVPRRLYSLHPVAVFANLLYHLRYDRNWTIEEIKKRFRISDKVLDLTVISYPWYPVKK